MERAESCSSTTNPATQVGKGCIDTNVLAETTTAEALPGTSNVKEDQGSQHPDTMEIEKGLAYCSEGVTTIQNWCENISERIQELRAMLASSKKRKERSSSQTLRTPPFALDLSGTSPEEDIMKGKTTHASAGGGSSSGREATSQRLYPNLKSYIVWVDVKGRLPVRLTGNQIKMGILKPVELDSNIIAATVRLLSEFERNMILHRSNGASRHYIPPEWTSYVTAGNFEAHISEQYFKNSPTGYDLTTCNMLLAPVRFGQGWSCYAINVPESTLTVMDPFLKADAGNIRIQWHQITARKVLEEAIRCFDIVRSVDTAETTKWKVNIQLLTEVKCCTWDTGIYTMTCMRWYEPEVDVSIIRLDERTAYEARKQLAHDLINMECNHAQLPHRLPTST
ncbi:uncharacterized protein LOC120701491 isoform X3 [Panicum virgatum]|uniref:uncharacterized protein LOC120701491 isoform X3 n=1 Tax=Panicum virgatum TaxID=38727 RepID=UPI0019D591A8|nr:uncharacterized protein LOC120701491 isoform X3 [Panicum virgatum]